MIEGIAIFGCNGAGKSTIAHMLAKEIDYYEIDSEDYYFPEQKESRQWCMDHSDSIPTKYLGNLPFSNPRTKDEVQNAILAEIIAHPKFVLTGVTMNWSDEVLSYIKIAFLAQAPLEVRLQRIHEREVKRFGSRVLNGGDMYQQQIEFQNVAANRDPNQIADDATKLQCPMITVDGTLPVTANIAFIMNTLNVKMQSHKGNSSLLHEMAGKQGSQMFIGPGDEEHMEHDLSHLVQQTPRGRFLTEQRLHLRDENWRDFEKECDFIHINNSGRANDSKE